MVQIVKLLGYNCANVTDEVKEIIEFENMLAKVSYFFSKVLGHTYFDKIFICLASNFVFFIVSSLPVSSIGRKPTSFCCLAPCIPVFQCADAAHSLC